MERKEIGRRKVPGLPGYELIFYETKRPHFLYPEKVRIDMELSIEGEAIRLLLPITCRREDYQSVMDSHAAEFKEKWEAASRSRNDNGF